MCWSGSRTGEVRVAERGSEAHLVMHCLLNVLVRPLGPSVTCSPMRAVAHQFVPERLLIRARFGAYASHVVDHERHANLPDEIGVFDARLHNHPARETGIHVLAGSIEEGNEHALLCGIWTPTTMDICDYLICKI